MKKKDLILSLAGTAVFLVSFISVINAMPPPPPDPTPVGGGIIFLIAAGAVYGGSKLYKHRKNK